MIILNDDLPSKYTHRKKLYEDSNSNDSHTASPTNLNESGLFITEMTEAEGQGQK